MGLSAERLISKEDGDGSMSRPRTGGSSRRFISAPCTLKITSFATQSHFSKQCVILDLVPSTFLTDAVPQRGGPCLLQSTSHVHSIPLREERKVSAASIQSHAEVVSEIGTWKRNAPPFAHSEDEFSLDRSTV